MRVSYLISLLLLVFISSVTYAQKQCGSVDFLKSQMEVDPRLKERMNEIENHTRKSTSKMTSRSTTGIITIPVVVHVLYNDSTENISDAQILSQLLVLNQDFRRLNSNKDNLWPQAADLEIEFRLATRDILGDASCGITRTYTDSTQFISSVSMKSSLTGGADPWPSSDYLNIWVCDLYEDFGIATFPGGDPELDGVVCDYQVFGTIGDLLPDYSLGRNATHQIGHWLNLNHIWGDGDCFFDDSVADTPLSDEPNYNCDVGHISCGSVDMVQNFMDRSDDSCMNLFTLGQKQRARALFDAGGNRESILHSEGCSVPFDSNTLFIEIDFDDYASDISWEVRDSSNAVIASHPAYPSSFDNTTVIETVNLIDGSYTFIISDSYGDGLCCNEGNGGYELYGRYASYHTSDGQFGSGETVQFDVYFKDYRFVGPGINWENASNWNKLSLPSECYEGIIYIDSNCDINEPFSHPSTRSLIISDSTTLTVRN